MKPVNLKNCIFDEHGSTRLHIPIIIVYNLKKIPLGTKEKGAMKKILKKLPNWNDL